MIITHDPQYLYPFFSTDSPTCEAYLKCGTSQHAWSVTIGSRYWRDMPCSDSDIMWHPSWNIQILIHSSWAGLRRQGLIRGPGGRPKEFWGWNVRCAFCILLRYSLKSLFWRARWCSTSSFTAGNSTVDRLWFLILIYLDVAWSVSQK